MLMKMAKKQMDSMIQEWMLTEMARMLWFKVGEVRVSASIEPSKIINALYVGSKWQDLAPFSTADKSQDTWEF